MKYKAIQSVMINCSLVFLIFIVLVLLSPVLHAGPEGGQVVAGQGHIQRPDAISTVVNQQSQSMAVNWQSFNVQSNESVRFVQPNASAAVLNRIQDQNPSQIFGTIDANGRVFLINPNGILFGAGSTINVGSLIASGLDINTAEFMRGNYTFNADQNTEGGVVVNRGVIQAATGGSVNLIGGAVKNEGVIIAQVGQINLAAGRSVVMDFDGDGLMRFEVDGHIVDNIKQVADAVANHGELIAEGGEILLSAKTAKDVFTRVINNEGVIKATRIETHGGVVRLVGEGGIVAHSGEIDVSGETAQSTGGTVHVLGDKVGLFDNGFIEASGDSGGGTVLIGGDFQGNNPEIKNAEFAYMGENTAINADAGVKGDGGKVIVWGNQVTRFYGDIKVRGGVQGGNGGLVETSAKYLDVVTSPDVSASQGKAGTWLLDPEDIEITNTQNNITQSGSGDPGPVSFAPTVIDTVTTIDVSNINTALDNGSNVLISTASGGTTTTGTITVNANVTKNADGGNNDGSVLSLSADNHILINNPVVSTAGLLAVDLNAVGNITINQSINTNGGDFNTNSTNFSMSDSTLIDSGSGEISVQAGGDITLGRLVSSSDTATAVSLTSTGGGIIDGGDSGGADIEATNASAVVTINALAGVGDVNAIDTNVANLAIDNATSGNILIEETNAVSIIKAAQGTAGNIQITTSDGAITVDNGGTVANAITTVGTGTITLTANGATNGDVAINDGVQSAAGDITLAAANNLVMDAAGDISSSSGDIRLTADADGGGAGSGGLTMSDGAEISTGSGTIALQAGDDISLGRVVTANDTATAVELTSTGGGIIDGGDSGGADIEATNAGAVVTINAVAGVGDANAIDTNVASLAIDNATSGNILIEETNAVSIIKAAQGTAGNIQITTSDGAITVDNDGAVANAITTVGTGTITLTANGATNGDVTINDGVQSAAGDVSLAAANNLVMDAAGDISSSSGDIRLTADADGGGSGSGGLTMSDGAEISTGSGTSALQAGGDIVLGRVVSSNDTATAVELTSTGAGIIDGGDSGGADIEATGAGAVVTINAETGVGDANAIDTNVANLAIDNATSGNILIEETNAVSIIKAAQGTAGNIQITTSDGAITVDNGGAVANAITTVGTGTITLTANGATNGNVTINDGVQSAAGDVSLAAANNLVMDAAGDISSSSGDIRLTADADGGGSGSGGLTMSDGAEISAGSGTIALQAGGDIVLGRVVSSNDTATAVSLTSTGAGIIDGGDSGGADIEASGANAVVTIDAGGGGIGISTAINTSITNELSLKTGGFGSAGDINVVENNSIDSGKIKIITDLSRQDINLTAQYWLINGELNVNGDNLILEANNGDITTLAVNTIFANDLRLTANGKDAAIGDSGAAINTNLSGNLSADTLNGAGGIFVNNTGSMQIGSINADAGDVVLTASAGISQRENGSISANNLTLQTSGEDTNIGTTDAAINTIIDGVLSADAGNGNGGVFIDNTGALRIASINAAVGDVAVRASGNITSSGTDIISATNLDIQTTGSGASIGSSNLSIITDLSGSLIAKAENGSGNIYIRNNSDLQIESISAGTGDVQLSASGRIADASDIDIDADITADHLLVLTANGIGNSIDDALNLAVNRFSVSDSSSDVYITVTDDLGVGTVNANENNVDIKSFQGSVLNSGSMITANDLTLIVEGADAAIGNQDSMLNTQIRGNFLAEASSGSGGVFINNSGDLNISQVAAGTGNIELMTTGKMTIEGIVTTAKDISLSSSNGAISVGNADSSNFAQILSSDGMVTLTVKGNNSIINQNRLNDGSETETEIGAKFLTVNLGNGNMGSLVAPFDIQIDVLSLFPGIPQDQLNSRIFISAGSSLGSLTSALLLDVGSILAQVGATQNAVNQEINLIDPSLFLTEISLFSVENSGIKKPADQLEEH